MSSAFLIQLFQALESHELPGLRKFLQSPYFNHRNDVQVLFNYLVECRKTSWDMFDKRAAFERLFPGAPYNSRRLNHVMSYLTRLVERYFTLEDIRQDEPLLRLRHCRALRKRGIALQFERDLALLERAHGARPARDATYYLYAYELCLERYAWEALRTRAAHARAPVAAAALTHFFMLENLRWACTAESARAVSAAGEHYQVPLTEAVLHESAAAEADDHPTLALLRESLLTLRERDGEQHFTQLRALLSTYVRRLPPAEARDAYMAAINFAIRRHNRGDAVYTRHAFDLYRSALEQGVLVENARLPKYTFINIFTLAQLAGEPDWAHHFLEHYRDRLPEADRDNIHRYCLAGRYFRLGDYGRVLELLRAVEFNEPFIQLDVRKMLLRSYFELGEWAALDSLLASFRTYLRRKKDLGYHREGYLNLIRFAKKLSGVRALSPGQKRRLAQQIRETPLLTEREWLLGMLAG